MNAQVIKLKSINISPYGVALVRTDVCTVNSGKYRQHHSILTQQATNETLSYEICWYNSCHSHMRSQRKQFIHIKSSPLAMHNDSVLMAVKR